MATNLQESTDTILTPQETEAVLELWAKKQAEGEALKARVSVRDLAEAMSLPPGEVEKLLIHVRADFTTPMPSVAKQVRPVNKALIGIAALTWVVVLVTACFFSFRMGYERRASLTEQPGMPYLDAPIALAPPAMELLEGEPATFTPTPYQDLSSILQKGTEIQFKGYRAAGKANNEHSEEDIFFGVSNLVARVASPSRVSGDQTLSGQEIVDALESNDPAKTKGQIKFETLTVTGPAGHYEAKIPVPLVSDQNVVRLVGEEQIRRLRIAANQAKNFESK